MPFFARIYLSILLCLTALPALAQPVETIPNLTYKTVDTLSLQLDLYRPAMKSEEKLPLVIYIHGGSWRAGNRNEVTERYRGPLLQALLQEGYSVASIDYRLTSSDGWHFPKPIEDTKDAIRWLRANAASYGLDPERIGLWGASAGGHLAMLAAYTDDQTFLGDRALAATSARVDFVLNNFGPTDLNALFWSRLPNVALWFVKVFASDTYALRQNRLREITGFASLDAVDPLTDFCKTYSPVTYASRQPVPTLTLHGDEDETVPYSQAKLLAASFNGSASHELVTYPKARHSFSNFSQDQTENLIARSLAFIRKHQPK